MAGKYARGVAVRGYGASFSGGDPNFSQFQSTIESYSDVNRVKQSSLKILRRNRGLTLEALSELTGISPSYLSRLEAGARRLNTDLLERLSAVLGCQPADLLNTSPQSPVGGFLGAGRSRIMGLTATTPIDFSGNPQGHDAQTEQSSQKDLPIYTISTSLGVLPGGTNEPSMVDFSTPADWALRPPQLIGISKAFALCVGDEGYAPKYMSGDILFVHPSRPLLPRSSVLVVTKDQRALVRRFHGWAQNTILVAPFDHQKDTDQGVESIEKEDLKAVYKIIGTMEAF